MQLLRDYQQWQLRERLRIGSKWARKVCILGKTVDNDLLFTKWDGQPIDPNSVTSWFPRFLREHDLPPVRFHSLRHSNAALLIAAHVPVTTVAGRLGHAQVSTTTNIYAGSVSYTHLDVYKRQFYALIFLLRTISAASCGACASASISSAMASKNWLSSWLVISSVSRCV